MQLAPQRSQPARDFALGQLRELADRSDSPHLEGLGELHLRRELRERQRREKPRLLPLRHDRGRVGQSGGDPRGELRGRDPEPRGQARLLDRRDDGAAQAELGGSLASLGMTRGKRRHRDPDRVEIDDPFSGGLHARRKAVCGFRQRFLRRALALQIAAPREEVGQKGARLGQGLARLDPGPTRGAGRGHDAGGVAVAFEDRDGLARELRLAAQPSGERKERHDDAGDARRGGGHGSRGVW